MRIWSNLSIIMKVLPKNVTSFLWNILYSRRGNIANGIRYSILRARSKSCGNNILISSNVLISGLKTLEIGNNVQIYKDSYIDAMAGLKIGSNVSIGHQVSIMTTGRSGRIEEAIGNQISIGDNVWIGGGTKILPGVEIGENAVIQPGSVLFESVRSSTEVRGNPATVYKG